MREGAVLCKCFIKGSYASWSSFLSLLQTWVYGTRRFPSTLGWGGYLRNPPSRSPKELKPTGFSLSEDPDRACGSLCLRLTKGLGMQTTALQWGCLVLFLYILTLWARLGAEPTNRAITFPKTTFSTLQSFFRGVLTARTVIWVDLKGKVEVESQFWKPMSHALKHGC